MGRMSFLVVTAMVVGLVGAAIPARVASASPDPSLDGVVLLTPTCAASPTPSLFSVTATSDGSGSILNWLSFVNGHSQIGAGLNWDVYFGPGTSTQTIDTYTHGVPAGTTITVVFTFTDQTQKADYGSQTISFNCSTGGKVPSQVIAFKPLRFRNVGDPPFDISSYASASSGLPVSFTSMTPRVCDTADAPGAVTGTGSLVTLLAAGTCRIEASQAGNSSFAPAPDQTQSFKIRAIPARCRHAGSPTHHSGFGHRRRRSWPFRAGLRRRACTPCPTRR